MFWKCPWPWEVHILLWSWICVLKWGWSGEVILGQGPGETPSFSPGHRGTASFRRLPQQFPCKSIHAAAFMLGRGPVLVFPSNYFDFLYFAACAKTDDRHGPPGSPPVDNIWTCFSLPFLCTGSLELDIWRLAGPVRGRGGAQ